VSATTVTLLNASYEPLGTVSFKQAVRMLFRQVAIVEEGDYSRMVGPHAWPQVIRLIRYIYEKWLDRPAKWHRGGVFIRDGHRCAYCGRKATTIDHLVPRSRGGQWSWENCVAACSGCNERKGDKTPDEAHMPLRYAAPYQPTVRQIVSGRRAAG